jgi:hypothetical protein
MEMNAMAMFPIKLAMLPKKLDKKVTFKNDPIRWERNDSNDKLLLDPGVNLFKNSCIRFMGCSNVAITLSIFISAS